MAYAKSARFEIAAEDWFYDPAVSGADPIETRPGLVDRYFRPHFCERRSRCLRNLHVNSLALEEAVTRQSRQPNVCRFLVVHCAGDAPPTSSSVRLSNAMSSCFSFVLSHWGRRAAAAS